MNTEWDDFLVSQGAVFSSETNHKVITFGAPDIEHHVVRHGALMASLANTGLIRISGEDAKAFLQSQLTQDVNLVTETQAQLAAYCDPQGQVLGLGLLCLYQGAYYWQVPRDTLLLLLKRLKMFVMRSQVVLEDFTDLLPRFGYAGIHIEQDIVVMLNETMPQEPYAQHQFTDAALEDVIMIRLPTAHPCAWFMGPGPALGHLWDILETNGTKVGNDDWDLMDTAFGLPSINEAISGKFKAHELNLDRIGAISFKKGCYPGQEVIARMQYRGKPTKRLTRFHVSQAQGWQPGDTVEIFYGTDRSQSIEIVRCGLDLNEGSLVLAIASIKGLEDAQGFFMLADGSEVVMEPMGYRVAA